MKHNWISTYTHKKAHPLNLSLDEICISDIAHALSQVCRFTGHCSRFYSVGQHSIYVALLCSPKNKLWGLLHDASEAYIADIASPVKHATEMQAYRDIEEDIMLQIAERYHLPWPEPAEVKRIDAEMVNFEAHQLGLWTPAWGPMKGNLDFMLGKWMCEETEEIFLKLFKTYYKGE